MLWVSFKSYFISTEWNSVFRFTYSSKELEMSVLIFGVDYGLTIISDSYRVSLQSNKNVAIANVPTLMRYEVVACTNNSSVYVTGIGAKCNETGDGTRWVDGREAVTWFNNDLDIAPHSSTTRQCTQSVDGWSQRRRLYQVLNNSIQWRTNGRQLDNWRSVLIVLHVCRTRRQSTCLEARMKTSKQTKTSQCLTSLNGFAICVDYSTWLYLQQWQRLWLVSSSVVYIGLHRGAYWDSKQMPINRWLNTNIGK